MDYFPAFLDLRGRRVLLVGGGKIAARKLEMLLIAGAEVTIVSPETNASVEAAVAAARVTHVPRRFRPADIDGHWLVVSATGIAAVERLVGRSATARRVFINAVDDREHCSFITPAVIDRNPLIVAVSTAGNAPVLARRLRAELEARLPVRLGELVTLAGQWRRRVAEKLTGFAARLRFWERAFDADLQAYIDAGDVAMAERVLESLLSDTTPDNAGHAWLVGAGPGDPELLTLKALQAMQRADVILYDRLVSPAVLALARRDAELVAVGKAPGSLQTTQRAINDRLVALVRSGKRVCRLKGGDPFIFGRGGEEAEALARAGLGFSVVPGITAAAGCAAAAGIPLTHRQAAQSVVLLTAHGKDSIDRLDWPSLARDRQTLAFYMGVARYGHIMEMLTSHGRPPDTPIAIVERGTTAAQRVLRGTLGQLPMLARANGVCPPAMLFVGEVAAFDYADSGACEVPPPAARVGRRPNSVIQTA